MLTTLNGMFLEPKPHRINFIKENKKKLKNTSSMVYRDNLKSRIDITRMKQKLQNSQTEVTRSTSESSTALKEKNASSCKLSAKGSMAIFLQEKKDKGSSNLSLSNKQSSTQKIGTLRNQSCQTIDPRRCDQLYHDGVIKYPSNKVLEELAEIERQKANRLDAHVKKEYFRRNKVRQKSAKKLSLSQTPVKGGGKGDEIEEVHTSSSDEEIDEKEEKIKEAEPEPESKPEPESETMIRSKITKPQTAMRAAEIIRKTTEDFNYNRIQNHSEYNSNNKGDSKPFKKVTKKLSKEDILKTVMDPQCPPGHIPLPDMERKKTLHMLRVSHAELVREMNLLPVRTDTLRVRQKKIQLETQLNKIEEGIKVFNKSKVYVKIEE